MKAKTIKTTSAHHLGLDRFLPYQLLVVTSSITQVTAKLYDDKLGISIAEARVITVVDYFGPLSTHEIADRTRMDKPKISRAVKQMVAAGYLRRDTNQDDMRLITLTLTRAGEALRKRIVPIMEEVERSVFSRLEAADKATLARILKQLVEDDSHG